MNLRPPGYELCSEVRFGHFPSFPEIYYPKSNAFPLSFLRCLHCLFPVLGQVMGQVQKCGQGPHGVHQRLQRGQQTFFRQFLMVYSRFRSTSFAFRHSLKPVLPRVPRLSVAVYVVRNHCGTYTLRSEPERSQFKKMVKVKPVCPKHPQSDRNLGR